jgi:hypothetical protein
MLNPGVRAGAQGSAAGDSALSLAVSGRVIILDEGKASTSLHTAVVVPVGSASSTQQFELDITLPVLGVPLHGQASMEMDTQASSVLMVPSIRATGQAERVVLRGPAGDVTVSLKGDQPVHGFGSYDPAEATMHFRGTDGTGMFQGIQLAGSLRGFFRPAGQLYLSYQSRAAALEAVQRGLAGNTALTDAERRDLLAQTQRAVAQAVPAPFPADDDTQAVVTSSIERSGEQARVALRITVPKGDAHQPIKVTAIAPDGTATTVFDAVRAPGQTISTSALGTPPFVVQVHISGVMVKQIVVPAQ